MNASETKPHFFVFCTSDRKSAYEDSLKGAPYIYSYPATVEDLLFACRTESPAAVIVDIVSAARLGGALLTSLFEMEVRWPKLRCIVKPDGTATAMCTNPDWTGTLADAIKGIAADDPEWRLAWQRRDYRLQFRCRLRWRRAGEESWTLANTLDISCGGAFVVMYDPPPRGQRLELEFHDLQPEPTRVEAEVRRVRRWHDDVELPGAGVMFDAATMPAECRQAIKNIIGFSAMKAGDCGERGSS